VSVSIPLGATIDARGTARFLVWAPKAQRVDLHVQGGSRLQMERGADGYFAAAMAGVAPGLRYSYSLDGGANRPDPASRHQPEGPHGPSELVERDFAWTDRDWRGHPLSRYVIYELHVGTFTPAGTFEAALERLDDVKELGVTAVELMPVAQFPGGRNWGYDGVGLYAAQSSYGGPLGLKRLVDACHARGMAVVLDVVYNHFGPEGNYLAEFGPYFTERYKTPWGPALNFDGEHSDHVRRFFIENALYWISECHIDALRLDAIHAIVDPSPVPFVQELAAAVHRRAAELGRDVHLIAESAANDSRLIGEPERGGIGMDAQWNDDFHHALRTVLTGEAEGYYSSYGRVEHLAKAMREGFVYTGEHSAFHKRRHGSDCRDVPAERFVIFTQNHDHVGNRMMGERLNVLVSPERARLAAAAVILSPYIPLLFMGEEYAETAPFLYFVSHTDPKLVEAVRKGRSEEFAAFKWQGEAPDPQAEETFARSKLDHALRHRPGHREMLAYYRELLRLRREAPALAHLSKETLEVRFVEQERTLTVRRWAPPRPGEEHTEAFLAFNFGEADAEIAAPAGRWALSLDSNDEAYGGRGRTAPSEMKLTVPGVLRLAPLTFALYITQGI
jgi:maltooligosyltrehalose trehalohydrolase